MHGTAILTAGMDKEDMSLTQTNMASAFIQTHAIFQESRADAALTRQMQETRDSCAFFLLLQCVRGLTGTARARMQALPVAHVGRRAEPNAAQRQEEATALRPLLLTAY